MRFHTSLTLADIRSVELPPGVSWHHVREYGSQSRARGFEIVLEGTSNRGGQWGDRDYSAGTWDEWGVVLGRLFDMDPNARVARIYEGAEHYHYVTGDRFHPNRLPERLCPRHKWDRHGDSTATCKKGCGAEMRWDWNADPEPRDDTAWVAPIASFVETMRPGGPRVWTATPADFLAGRTQNPRVWPPATTSFVDPELGKYASDGAYEADLARNPIDLLDRIDELIKEAP